MSARAILVTVVLLATAGVVSAQERPGNSAQEISVEVSRGAVGYDPEIGTTFDGVVHDMRVTVTRDLLYVQIDSGTGLSAIDEIVDFVVVTD